MYTVFVFDIQKLLKFFIEYCIINYLIYHVIVFTKPHTFELNKHYSCKIVNKPTNY